MATPPLGLLLDVDGPIASPITRTIAIETITKDLVTLANQGIPVVFNTGRSDVFIRDQVVKPMLAAGLAMDARVFGVCEKGAVWFGATMTNFVGVQVDRSLALPTGIVAELRALFDVRYSDTMFWDDGKHAMVSLEQRTDVTPAEFLPQRDRFAADAFDLLERNGVGAELGDRSSAHPVSVRIEPTVISTDIERVSLGKALGAERALLLLADSGPIPSHWRTVGDSRSDYGMADHLHANGFDVAHVDVRPADGIPDKPYRVITQGDLIHDEAGAEFLAHWVREFAE
ncbi:MAG: hypothetical protein LH605_11650 [Microbacteriaceae bacterium]|nr:hypothetical protein [Microbacteriaceae bacterium]